MSNIFHRIGKARFYAWVAAGGIIGFVLGIIALHFVEPGFDPMQRFLSEYARTPHGAIMEACFFVLALAIGALGLSLSAHLREMNRAVTSAYPLLAAALCLALLGIFPTDLHGENKTLVGIIHNRLSLIPFGLLIINAHLLEKEFSKSVGWRGFRYLTRTLATIAVVAPLLGCIAQKRLLWTGLTQRLTTLPVILWAGSLAVRLTLPTQALKE